MYFKVTNVINFCWDEGIFFKINNKITELNKNYKNIEYLHLFYLRYILELVLLRKPKNTMNTTKYVFVTGGVTSSLGKGIIAASLAKLSAV